MGGKPQRPGIGGLLRRPEGESHEYKESATAVSSDLLVALANRAGGTIIVGVRDPAADDGIPRNDELIGCVFSDEERRAIQSRANSCIPPVIVRLTRAAYDGLYFGVVDVMATESAPHCTSGGTYKIRTGTQNSTLEPERLLRMFVSREGEQFLGRFSAASEAVVSQIRTLNQEVVGRIAEIVTSIAAIEARIARSQEK